MEERELDASLGLGVRFEIRTFFHHDVVIRGTTAPWVCTRLILYVCIYAVVDRKSPRQKDRSAVLGLK